MHLSPFTCVRTKRVQPFVYVFEKHKIPLVLCGHNHLYTRSIPIYSRFPQTEVAGNIAKYNTYYDFTKKEPTAYVDEMTTKNADGLVGINHAADKRNGTYYVMCPSTGWKNSGKETHISIYPTDAKDGYDKNVNGFTDGRVWWNAKENTVALPGYLTLDITNEKIDLKFYQIQGAKAQKEYNGKHYEYAPDIRDLNMTRNLVDSFTINKSDR